MEAAKLYEISVHFHQATQRHIPQTTSLLTHCLKSLEEHINLLILFVTVWGGPYSVYEAPMADFKI